MKLGAHSAHTHPCHCSDVCMHPVCALIFLSLCNTHTCTESPRSLSYSDVLILLHTGTCIQFFSAHTCILFWYTKTLLHAHGSPSHSPVCHPHLPPPPALHLHLVTFTQAAPMRRQFQVSRSFQEPG